MCPRYDIKSSDGEAPAMEIWGMSSTSSLPLLPGPLWPGVLATDRVLSIGQIEQTVCKQMTDVKLRMLCSNTRNHLTAYKKITGSFNNVIYKMCSQIICIFSKLATVIDGDQKAPFSIATTPKEEVSSTIFKVFGMTWPGIEPRPLANTLPTWPMSRF